MSRKYRVLEYAPWLGASPIDWDYVKVTYLGKLGRGRVISNLELSPNGKYPVFSSQTKNKGEMGQIDTYDFDGEYVTWTTDGANAGTVFARQGKFNCTNVCGTIKTNDIVSNNFLAYVLSIETKRYVRIDINPKLMNTEMAQIRVLVPPYREQIKIERYLDQKTSEIDTLIADKEKLITLLEEKRQAVITETVTKGLDPNVKMKDSGIEWIGEIPEHWEVVKLKYIGKSIMGLLYSPKDICGENEGILVLRASNIQRGNIDTKRKDNVYVNKEVNENLTTHKNDLLICARSGSRELIGKSAIIDEESAGNSFGAFTTVYRSVYNPFIRYVFQSGLFQSQIGTYLTSTINQLTMRNLNNLEIVLPPIEDQDEIQEKLDRYTENHKQVVKEIKQQISKLKQYRESLIYEAVTGKIDLQDYGEVSEPLVAERGEKYGN